LDRASTNQQTSRGQRDNGENAGGRIDQHMNVSGPQVQIMTVISCMTVTVMMMVMRIVLQ